MTSQPLVSIIIPVYNGSNYVREAIESALAQTYPRIEVVVVNDGSTDGGATRAAVESFGTALRYIEKANGGVATALNAGIAVMRGELMSWLSHDDLYKPEKVARQVNRWRDGGPKAVVIGDFEQMDESGKFIQSVSVAGRSLAARPLDAVFRGLINGCALLVPRALFAETGLFEPGLPTTQDYELWYRAARIAPFLHCPHADVRQRVHEGQGSRHGAHLAEASRMFADLIDRTPPELMRAYDGSEIRFLSGVRNALFPYAGLRAYLDFRIECLAQERRYDVRRAGDRTLVPGSHPAVLFGPGEGAVDERLAAAAAKALFAAGADVARPAGGAGLEGVIAMWRAAGALHAAAQSGPIDWDSMGKRFAVIEFGPDPGEADEVPVEPATPAAALAGRVAIPFGSGISENATAEALGAAGTANRPAILLVAHSDPALLFVREIAAAAARWANPIVARGDGNSVYLQAGASASGSGGIVFLLPEHRDALARILRAAGVARIDVHHDAGFGAETETLIQALGAPFDVTPAGCDALRGGAAVAGDEGPHPPMPELPPMWRAASRIVASSRAMAAELSRAFPEARPVAAEHWTERQSMQVRHVFTPRIWGGEPLRVLLSGEPGPCANLVWEVAEASRRRRLPLRFHVLGAFSAPGATGNGLGCVLTVHGPCRPEQFPEWLGRIAPHVGWLPNPSLGWDCVLTSYIESALPVAAAAAGSAPERCHGRPATWLLPAAAKPEAWIDLFLRLHATGLGLEPKWADIRSLPPTQPFYFEEYLQPVRGDLR